MKMVKGMAGKPGGALMKKDTLRIKKDVLLCRELLNEVRTFYEREYGNPY